MSVAKNLHSVARQFNPDSLKLARELRGLRKNELANLLEITPSAITQFENGQSRPHPQNIARLSMALKVPPMFFTTSNQIRMISSDHCHFRSLKSFSQRGRRKMAGVGSVIGSVVEVIDRYVNLPREQVTDATSYGVTTMEDIEEAATKLRRNWGLGLGPIHNVVELLESKGILVLRLQDDCRDLDAFSLWHLGRPYIFLNTEKDSVSRNRFDAAHELGHLIIHADYLPGDSRQEEEANRFASAFLLPRGTFVHECPKRLVWDHYLELKERWKVSLAALVRRAKDLKLLSDDTYRRAYYQLNKRGWRNREPSEPEVERPSILPQAMGMLYEQGVSISSIARELNVFEADLASVLIMENAKTIRSPTQSRSEEYRS
jgi:Zn-dependent peptidase ImmA (M78 family)/DNA-binding XRE family transcriptional regulator